MRDGVFVLDMRLFHVDSAREAVRCATIFLLLSYRLLTSIDNLLLYKLLLLLKYLLLLSLHHFCNLLLLKVLLGLILLLLVIEDLLFLTFCCRNTALQTLNLLL